MSTFRIALNAAFLLFIFVIQETVIASMHLPITGFSLYLVVLIAIVLLENRIGAVILGFMGGLILDLSPASQSPVGQWALILTGVAYLISVNAENVDEIISRPIGLGLFVAAGSALTLFLYLVMDGLLGRATGSLGRDFLIIGGNFLWSAVITPFLLPVLVLIRDTMIGSRERI